MADKAHKNTKDMRKADPLGKTNSVTKLRDKNGPDFARKSNPEAAQGDGPRRIES